LESTWLKLPALLDIINNDRKAKKYDWYMWIDADVVFTNSSCSFQELLSDNHHVILPGDFNSGVFIVRNNDWSITFLENWLSLRLKLII
jgi:hypothetical protein